MPEVRLRARGSPTRCDWRRRARPCRRESPRQRSEKRSIAMREVALARGAQRARAGRARDSATPQAPRALGHRRRRAARRPSASSAPELRTRCQRDAAPARRATARRAQPRRPRSVPASAAGQRRRADRDDHAAQRRFAFIDTCGNCRSARQPRGDSRCRAPSRSGVLAEGLERLAQAPDVDVDRALLDVDVVAPDLVEQLRAAVHALGVRQEEVQQAELGRAERAPAVPSTGDAVRGRDRASARPRPAAPARLRARAGAART